MNDAPRRARFDRDGFLVVPGLLAPPGLAELAARLDRYIREVVPGVPPSDAFYDDPGRPETLKQMHRLDRDPYFAGLRSGPSPFRSLAEELLGEPVEVEPPEWFNKPPGTRNATPPHQDNYYFCLRPANVVTIWLALDPVDEENGCLRFVPGSHRLGVRPHGRTETLGFSQGITDYGEADRAAEVAACLRPGDATAHHGDMIHRADPNRSATRARRSFALVFRGVSCRRDEDAYARYLSAARSQRGESEASDTA
jgi:phytanoyl-CoA hydroxylase